MEKTDIQLIIEMISKDTCEFEKIKSNRGWTIKTSRGVKFNFNEDESIWFIIKD